MITVSIVSHSHGSMVKRLVAQLSTFPEVTRILVTLNVPEPWDIPESQKVRLIRNDDPKGFGSNHNFAFRHDVDSPFFCVMNPDVDLAHNPFPKLLECIEQQSASIVAPAILDPNGNQEDSARYFPTFTGLFKKLIGVSDGRYKFSLGDSPLCVDWVAGMFMLFPAAVFEHLRGFDESYFLYYEDVDICYRAHVEKVRVILCPQSIAVHDARRSSRRNVRHFCWHLSSMSRFLLKRHSRWNL